MVSEPQKELRFTRSGQAVGFGVLGAIFVSAALTLVATGVYRDENPELPNPLWALPCIAFALGCFWLTRHLAKHAYVILTPLGLEIFPFFFPSKNLRLVLWQEIVVAEISDDAKWLTLHFNEEKSSGLHLSLKPMDRKFRSLLAKAVLGRVSRRNA
ncbi:MAG: hypothetical protein V4727_03285 [Verrucomicrobiota bacterium]